MILAGFEVAAAAALTGVPFNPVDEEANGAAVDVFLPTIDIPTIPTPESATRLDCGVSKSSSSSSRLRFPPINVEAVLAVEVDVTEVAVEVERVGERE